MWHGTGEMSDSETKCISYKVKSICLEIAFFFCKSNLPGIDEDLLQ